MIFIKQKFSNILYFNRPDNGNGNVAINIINAKSESNGGHFPKKQSSIEMTPLMPIPSTQPESKSLIPRREQAEVLVTVTKNCESAKRWVWIENGMKVEETLELAKKYQFEVEKTFKKSPCEIRKFEMSLER